MKIKLPTHIDFAGLTKMERFKAIATWFLAKNRMSLVVGVMISLWIGISWIVLMFEKGGQNAQIDTLGKALWWGIVTFMTVGYGDLTPLTTGGRVAAGFLMLSGVFAIEIGRAHV